MNVDAGQKIVKNEEFFIEVIVPKWLNTEDYVGCSLQSRGR